MEVNDVPQEVIVHATDIELVHGRYLINALMDAKLVSTSAQARRFIQQGAVTLNGVIEGNVDKFLSIGLHLISVGKKNVQAKWLTICRAPSDNSHG